MGIPKSENQMEDSTMEIVSTEEEKKIVLIGVKMDQKSREMLTWALVNLAHSGDQFVACHVIATPGTSYSSLNSELDSMLAVYEGFCHLKQVELKLKICRGLSVRRALVREANILGASNLIIGVAKNKHRIGHSLAIAKYCTKKLHLTCSVISVNNGKIIFQSEINDKNKSKSEENPNNESELFCVLPSRYHNTNNSNSSSNLNPNPIETNTQINEDKDLYCPWPPSKSPVQALNADPYNISEDESSSSISSSCNSPSESSRKMSSHSFGLRRRVLTHRRCVSSDWTMVRRLMNFSNGSRPVGPLRAVERSNSFDFQLGEDWPPKELESFKDKYEKIIRVFEFDQLDLATSIFSQDNLIGKGGTSRVYKASFEEGKDLAVKVLKPSDEAVKEFISEIEIVASLHHHKNIISLCGFCFENNSLILVYDYSPNGSLEETLHGGKEKKNILSWKERNIIALGIAEALDYLHTESIIHADVKSSNILLSGNFEPQLSDFGLAKRVSSPASNLTCTDIAGTFGYLAPECFMYGQVNEKIDVYAYGVVLLELLSGRMPIKTGSPKGHESLVAWAKPLLVNGKIEELVDPCLINECNGEEMERIILAASSCLRNDPQSRPSMSFVVKLLQGDEEAKQWCGSQISISEEGLDGSDEELSPSHGSNIKSYLNLALLDLDEDSVSVSSTDQTVDLASLNASIEDYLDRWSRTSSFE